MTFRSDPRNSTGSRYLIFQDRQADEQPVYRITLPGLPQEQVASRKNFLRADVVRYSLTGLTPDGSPVAVIGKENSNVYALDIEMP